jgi:hypothetical protein
MSQIHEHPYGAGPHPGTSWPTMPPPAPHPFVPAPRRGDVPPAGLSYGYGPPTPYGAGPPTSWMPPAPPPPPPPRRGRTALIAFVLGLVLLGGIVLAVTIMARALPAPPAPGPAAPPAQSGPPSSPYTLTSMFGGNGTCSPATADAQIPMSTEGLTCSGQGDGTAFVFYEYSVPTDTFQDTLVREWGGSGLTQRAQDDCRTQYTGTIDVPGVGATPVVVDVYRHSPFMAVTATASSGSGRGGGTDSTTPQYRVADRGSLCAGG